MDAVGREPGRGKNTDKLREWIRACRLEGGWLGFSVAPVPSGAELEVFMGAGAGGKVYIFGYEKEDMLVGGVGTGKDGARGEGTEGVKAETERVRAWVGPAGAGVDRNDEEVKPLIPFGGCWRLNPGRNAPPDSE